MPDKGIGPSEKKKKSLGFEGAKSIGPMPAPPWYDLPSGIRKVGSALSIGGTPYGSLVNTGSELGAQIAETLMGRRSPGGGEAGPLVESLARGLFPTAKGRKPSYDEMQRMYDLEDAVYGPIAHSLITAGKDVASDHSEILDYLKEKAKGLGPSFGRRVWR